MLNRIVRTAVVAAACCSPLLADDMKGDMSMDKDMMMKMKQDMSDPSKMGMMKEDMTKMMVEDKMAHMMAMDPDFQKMHMDMMKSDSGKMAMPSDTDMMNAKQAIMNDPMAMKMVEMKAMMMDAMKNDPDMKKMMMGDDMKK